MLYAYIRPQKGYNTCSYMPMGIGEGCQHIPPPIAGTAMGQAVNKQQYARADPRGGAACRTYKQQGQKKGARPPKYIMAITTRNLIHLSGKAFVLLAALLPLAVCAQRGFINEGAQIYIQKGAVMNVEGTFVNGNSDTSLGFVHNDGIIQLGGDFENQAGAGFGIFDDSTSKERAVRFVGTGTQAIKGDLEDASFYNLVIDKANATDTVVLEAPVKVDGSLIFGAVHNSTYAPDSIPASAGNKGLIKTYGNMGEMTLTLNNGATDAIAGYAQPQVNSSANTGYILTSGIRNSANGGLQRNINTAAPYTFPIATAENGYNAVTLNFTQVPAGGALVKGKFSDGTDNAEGYVGYVASNNVQGADNSGYNKYFASNPCNGGMEQWFTLNDGVKGHGYWSFEAAANAEGFKYVAELFPASFEAEGTEADAVRAVKYNAAYGDNVSAAATDWGRDMEDVEDIADLLTYSKNMGCYGGDGIPGGEYTGFGHMALKMGTGGTALPVEMVYVKAEGKDNSSIEVSWATALEINNSGFEVQRSKDGRNFETIGWVAGAGNSTTMLTYSYSDKDVAAGTVYYYQLRQVDNDGASETSQVVSASIMGGNTAPVVTVSEIMPNPAVAYSHIAVNSATAQDVQVAVYDMTGRMVSNTTQPIGAGTSAVTVDVTMLANGNYTTVLVIGGGSFAKKLLVAKN